MSAPTSQIRHLYLLRHAKSSWDDPALADLDRPLAPRGRKAVKKIARYLRQEGIDPQVVLCSPALRTRQTLERLGSVVREDVSVRIEPKLYGAGRDDLLARIRRLPMSATSAMVIGHNPGLQDLAVGLAGTGSDRTRIETKFPTAALAALSFEGASWRDLEAGRARLVALVTPADLG